MVALESENLPVHEVTVESDALDTLGVCFTRGGARPTFRRVHRLRQAVVAMARSPFMTSKQIEIVLGHMTYCLLLGRPGLSVFKSAYTFVLRKFQKTRRLWKSVLREFQTAAGLLPMIQVDFRTPWRNVVHCSDASLFGMAIHQTDWCGDDVRACATVNEK